MTESKPAAEFMEGDFYPESAQSRIERSNTVLPEYIYILAALLSKMHTQGFLNEGSENWGKA